MISNFLTDCRNFIGNTNKLIYSNSEFNMFVIMFLCVNDYDLCFFMNTSKRGAS